MKREPSVVEVDVIDLRSLELDAFNYVREKVSDDVVSVCTLFGWRWGIVETTKGLCALNDEGLSEYGPLRLRSITNKRKLWLVFVVQHQHPDIRTPLSISLGQKELKALPVEKQEKLSEFVRTGPRYERRYREWESALSEIALPKN